MIAQRYEVIEEQARSVLENVIDTTKKNTQPAMLQKHNHLQLLNPAHLMRHGRPDTRRLQFPNGRTRAAGSKQSNILASESSDTLLTCGSYKMSLLPAVVALPSARISRQALGDYCLRTGTVVSSSCIRSEAGAKT